ncbi:hypothetical protein GYMLUDRAFT_251880 [Collybiopsis luxurians FD-317 M1]|uniref:Uncharacterized protein n=1 Tax=Collybiopsis luxurians FD-317 M1 TaxID=944289 RepID=A0A0D0C1M4_9AGAR|nr:hypothetical protein GYMLUDRAFT_251880 [Collybiopsis luxurians FD-317 M1]
MAVSAKSRSSTSTSTNAGSVAGVSVVAFVIATASLLILLRRRRARFRHMQSRPFIAPLAASESSLDVVQAQTAHPISRGNTRQLKVSPRGAAISYRNPGTQSLPEMTAGPPNLQVDLEAGLTTTSPYPQTNEPAVEPMETHLRSLQYRITQMIDDVQRLQAWMENQESPPTYASE